MIEGGWVQHLDENGTRDCRSRASPTSSYPLLPPSASRLFPWQSLAALVWLSTSAQLKIPCLPISIPATICHPHRASISILHRLAAMTGQSLATAETSRQRGRNASSAAIDIHMRKLVYVIVAATSSGLCERQVSLHPEPVVGFRLGLPRLDDGCLHVLWRSPASTEGNEPWMDGPYGQAEGPS